jgi:hypothetical protein
MPLVATLVTALFVTLFVHLLVFAEALYSQTTLFSHCPFLLKRKRPLMRAIFPNQEALVGSTGRRVGWLFESK